MTLRSISLLAIALATAGCSAPKPPPTQDPPVPQAAAQPEANTEMRDAIQRPIQKAQGVEDATLKAAADQRKQIEDAGG